jgi:hypothetical protein
MIRNANMQQVAWSTGSAERHFRAKGLYSWRRAQGLIPRRLLREQLRPNHSNLRDESGHGEFKQA